MRKKNRKSVRREGAARDGHAGVEGLPTLPPGRRAERQPCPAGGGTDGPDEGAVGGLRAAPARWAAQFSLEGASLDRAWIYH